MNACNKRSILSLIFPYFKKNISVPEMGRWPKMKALQELK